MLRHTFSTEWLPPADRRDGTIHFMSSFSEPIEIYPIEEALRIGATYAGTTGLHGLRSRNSAQRVVFPGQGRMSDHLCLGFVGSQKPFLQTVAGKTIAAAPGDATIRLMEQSMSFEVGSETDFDCLFVPLAEINARLRPGQRVTSQGLEAARPGLGLLRSYCDLMYRETLFGHEAEARAFAGHVYDLLALAVGADRLTEASARERGIPAARLALAKEFIHDNITDVRLNDRLVAAHLGVSDRYVRMMFDHDGTSCKTYIDETRLALAYSRLRNPLFSGVKLIDLAYRCGFNDISTFNRRFRARYGLTPSEVRNHPEASGLVAYMPKDSGPST